ncbi:hypothetical protein QLX08_010780 [Tetragonisca angustula]|uniref:Uncharacterized protein n=1 Tax=Tetragonisca angustula TaxID=166442 RepID=A0AAW0ZAU1_9HYME
METITTSADNEPEEAWAQCANPRPASARRLEKSTGSDPPLCPLRRSKRFTLAGSSERFCLEQRTNPRDSQPGLRCFR